MIRVRVPARERNMFTTKGFAAALRPLPNPGFRHDILVRKYSPVATAAAGRFQMIGSSFRKLMAMFAVTLALGMLVSPADARVGGGASAGSRGARTFSAPPTTRTAPTQAAPIQRSITQPSSQPRFGTPATQPGGFFSRGLLGGLAGGFIGAGL